MNKTWILLFFSFIVCVAIQAGNTPCSPTSLNGISNLELFSTSGNAGSNVPDPLCGNYSGSDFWFEVTVGPTGQVYIISEADEITNGAMAIYEGSCNSPSLLRCVENDLCGNTEMPITSFQNLTPGTVLLIRFWAETSSPNGSFLFYAGENGLDAPNFNLVGNATYISNDCIRLTNSQTAQIGCAWLPEEVDFSQPLAHKMSVQFGSNTSFGADGICLTYQNNSTSICGITGQGIASQGIDHSLIIEFDTWRNNNFSDPFEDHIAVNINGDMNHANSIAGPVSMGELEDGQEHIIEFRWEPSTMEYTVIFDNLVIIQSTFDIINNCFGGDPLVYWGYTSSTGAAFNEHVMCPEVPNYPHGVIDSVNKEICEGESYFAGGTFQTTSGIYTDVFPSFSGCDSIVITNLVVNDIPSSVLDTTICSGACVNIGGQSFCTSTAEEVMISSPLLPCDSIVELTLTVLDPIANISGVSNILNCDVTELELSGIQSSGGNDLNHLWTGPNNFGSIDETISINQAGVYTLVVEVTENGVTCTSAPATYEVVIDTIKPFVNAGTDILVPCSEIDTFLNGSGSSAIGSISYEWYFQSNLISTSVTPSINEVGLYTLVVTSNSNGCQAIDMVEVAFGGETPSIEASGGVINCKDSTATLTVDTALANATYTWFGPMSFVSEELNPTVNRAGIYRLEVDLFNGSCYVVDTVLVSIDTSIAIEVSDLAASFSLNEGDSISLNPNYLPSLTSIDSVQWSPPQFFSCADCPFTVLRPIDAGSFSLFVQDTNFCIQRIPFEVLLEKEKYFIPNSFSPNNDGVNDILRVFSSIDSRATIERFSIFNRWGDLVFQSENLSIQDIQHGWDGTFKNKPLDPASFAYIAIVRSHSGRKVVLRGDVSLLK